MTPEHRALRLGWTSLAIWAGLGLALEAAHALKLASYLDDDLTRLLLRLAHAHGVGLAIVAILFALSVAPRIAPALATHLVHALAIACICMPLGFALGALGHPEGDPSVLVVLAPIGALALVYALARIALALWRTS